MDGKKYIKRKVFFPHFLFRNARNKRRFGIFLRKVHSKKRFIYIFSRAMLHIFFISSAGKMYFLSAYITLHWISLHSLHHKSKPISSEFIRTNVLIVFHGLLKRRYYAETLFLSLNILLFHVKRSFKMSIAQYVKCKS